jgi:hypothetical protein
MSAFPKTRAAAGYGRSELARARRRAAAAAQRLLGGLVLAVRDPAGPAWLEAGGDDPDVAAFTAGLKIDTAA